MEAKDLKIALENYEHFVASVERIKLELEDLDTKRFKAGRSIARIPENPKKREEVIYDNLERLTILEKELEYNQRNVFLVSNFIDSLEDAPEEPIRSIVIDKYINKIGIYEMETKYHFDRKTIWRKIDYSIVDKTSKGGKYNAND